MSDSTCIRVHREERDQFAQIANQTIRDESLSFKATGLLCYLLSLPGDWEISQNHLSTVKTDGRDSVIAGFKELVTAGYIFKRYQRSPGGQIEATVWHVFETPKSDFPISAEPTSENPTLQIHKDKKTKLSSKARGTLEELKAFCVEIGIPESDGEYFFHHWEGTGWKISKRPIKCWRSTIRSWKIAGHLPSQNERNQRSTSNGAQQSSRNDNANRRVQGQYAGIGSVGVVRDDERPEAGGDEVRG